jgi:class 3 adenylate cyclase
VWHPFKPRCPQCGADTLPRAKFCGACGTPLTAQSPADRDPEEARQLLDPVLERMMAAAHQYEGTMNQVVGDGIMVLFGAPLAPEDHSVRACYAALAMQEAIRHYSEQVRHTHGVEV